MQSEIKPPVEGLLKWTRPNVPLESASGGVELGHHGGNNSVDKFLNQKESNLNQIWLQSEGKPSSLAADTMSINVIYFIESPHAESGLQPGFSVPSWHRTTTNYYINTPADISSFHLWYSTPTSLNALRSDTNALPASTRRAKDKDCQ